MFEWLTSTPIPQEQLSTLDSGGRVFVWKFIGALVGMIFPCSHGPENGESPSPDVRVVLLQGLDQRGEVAM
ncbi:MAG TPA: hypothetical protein PKA83_18180, partial [Pirellulaceae bacterium]|nr:hypothetical protein [Pirellulaceae bacterium]